MEKLSCSLELFLEDRAEDQTHQWPHIEHLGAQCEREILYQLHQPVPQKLRAESHMINRYIQCHHGYRESGIVIPPRDNPDFAAK